MGSAVGALALHVVMVACGSSGSTSSTGDGGMFADVRDAIVDAVGDVLDAEASDARADDGGTQPACNCTPLRSEFSFSGGALNRDGMAAQDPAVDFSTALISASLGRGDGGAPVVSVNLQASYYLQDGSRMSVLCTLLARPDGSVITVPATTVTPIVPAHDLACMFAQYESAEQVTGNSAVFGRPAAERISNSYYFTGSRITELTNERITVALPALPLHFERRMPAPSGMTTPAGEGSIAPITLRGYYPGASMITPSRAYRP